MRQVKIFSNISIENLENDVNEFLRQITHDIYNIELDVEIYQESILYNVLIVYEKY